MPRVIAVIGCKGSGKSTLIKALFPELNVDFSEVKRYRFYELPSGLAVAEVCASPEVLSNLILHKPPWQLHTSIVVIDGTQPLRIDGRALAFAAEAPRRALVMSKADASPRARAREVERLAQRFRFDFFSVSTVKGEGVSELRAWLLGEAYEKPPTPPTAAPALRPTELVEEFPPFDVVPVPAPAPIDDSGLTEEEKLVLGLCDGRRGVREIARELNAPYGRVKLIIDRLYGKRYIRDLRLKVSV